MKVEQDIPIWSGVTTGENLDLTLFILESFINIGGGRGLKNKSELLSHFSSSFVCFAYTNDDGLVSLEIQGHPLLIQSY
jgi:hypothetical protein